MDKKMEKGKMKDDIKEIEEYTTCWDALDFWTKFFFVGTAALCGMILLIAVQYLFN
ncbi:hypothetical protein Q2U85_30065 (plasmid) [Bacillus cereus]|uniref:hypothetical protein n=1 Tax=Bacillus cereus group TaxID=86661 RepID=UPI0014836B27|nr:MULTISPECIES: hypothetical protein [Bacillus cereus group]WKT67961.1 hypothetical protein Q2U85_30065 [Bacillus cereus]